MNVKSIWSPAVVLLAMGAAPPALAQDPAVVAPDIYKCTFENEHTRLCEVTFQPGAKIAKHSHPDHLVYVLQPGKLRITDDGTGESADTDFATGQSVWLPAVTHHGENMGGTEVKALVIEFKDLKGADMKPKK
jgi:quercetin dioxygenase-like cupin family protein